jgi:CxxC motif-containing protein
MNKEIICISCPIGCYLIVDYIGSTMSKVSGNRCKFGVEFAEKEVYNPERTLTTTVKVKHGHLPLISVKTDKPLPKSRILDAMILLAKVEVEAPIKIGEPIIQNIFNLEVNIVATRNVSKKTS